MGKALENEKYAIISDGQVVDIITHKNLSEWDDNTLHVVKIPINKEEYVIHGTGYDNQKQDFIYETLESLKEKHKAYLAWASDVDSSALLESFLPTSEFDTWNLQIQEAKEYIANKDESKLIFLPELAKIREISLEYLCNKVIEKNTEFNKKLAKIVGYRQKLLKDTESVSTPKELDLLKYKFIFYKPNANDLIQEAKEDNMSEEELLEKVQKYNDAELLAQVQEKLNN